MIYRGRRRQRPSPAARAPTAPRRRHAPDDGARPRERGDCARSGRARAPAGAGSCFWSGEPGIGKTRLCDEATAAAARAGVPVLWGRAWEAGGAPAYWPWMEVLAGLCRRMTDDALAATLGEGAGLLAELCRRCGDACLIARPWRRRRPRRPGSASGERWCRWSERRPSRADSCWCSTICTRPIALRCCCCMPWRASCVPLACCWWPPVAMWRRAWTPRPAS